MFQKERRGVSDTKFSVAMAIAGLAIIVVGMGFTIITSTQLNTIRSDQAQVQVLEKKLNSLNSSSTDSKSQVSAVADYTLGLVIANNQDQNFSSSLGPMPRYFVLGPDGLESSATISVPANTLVKLVIMNYDDGGQNVSAQLATVSGTVGNSMLVFNGTSETSASLQVNGIPAKGVLAHTFSVPQLGLNVPVPASSIVVAYVHFGKAGTYSWYCFSPCMPWSYMTAEKGWMTGAFTVQ